MTTTVKILLVDDEPFALKLLARQLAGLGYTNVVATEVAADALALVASGNPIDLVMCDLQMPEMDGIELMRHLASVGYTGAIVLVSGEDVRILHTAQMVAQSHHMNVLGALSKPIPPAELSRILEGLAGCVKTVPKRVSKSYSAVELEHGILAGQLVNHYQPKVDVASGLVQGVESLVRWGHPSDGLVYPDQFIATAEEHGLINILTDAVMTNTLRQTRLWLDAGIDIHVAINVSMDNLAAVEFPDRVAAEAKKEGVPLNRLELEVTESRLMRDPRAALDILTRLRLKRIGLSVDDFGTGYSSLAQLRDIPFDELKVDRGFVHGACYNPQLRGIFEASLGMAKHLGMRTVAEGVEDEADWEFLRLTGCDLAQGYFISKPMPAERLSAWLTAWEIRRPGLVR